MNHKSGCERRQFGVDALLLILQKTAPQKTVSQKNVSQKNVSQKTAPSKLAQ
jgi:hypothetical protein